MQFIYILKKIDVVLTALANSSLSENNLVD